MKTFILMIQFLTRIPIPIELEVDRSDFEKGIFFFPFVGAIIGLILMIEYHLLLGRVSAFLLGLIIVASEVLITGGLHLDGLSDSFDGLYSNRDRERILEIMKDSRLGANGALALFFFMLLKIGLVMELDPKHGLLLVFLMPIFARFNVVISCRFSKYAREDGMGNFFIGKVSNSHLFFLTIFIITMALKSSVAYLILVPSILFSFFYSNHVKKIIGGMTGDTLGALCELSEIWFLFLGVVISLFQ